MTAFSSFCQMTEQTSVAHAMSGVPWLFPAVETIHLVAMVALVGSISLFDLRLLGLVLRREPVSEIAGRMLPATWSAFAVMVTTGALLFTTDPVSKYCQNTAFEVKLLLIVMAGLNMSAFHLTIYSKVAKWDNEPSPPVWAKIVGTFSVILWAGVVVAGRWIGFA
jgi:hypothetical protein